MNFEEDGKDFDEWLKKNYPNLWVHCFTDEQKEKYK